MNRENARATGAACRTQDFDVVAETERIIIGLRQVVHQKLRRRGAIVGISGGVDSSVVLALCVRAFGPERVVAVMMPERDSSPDSLRLATKVAGQFGVVPLTEDITAALEGFGCYARRDEAVARLFPEFSTGWKVKITLPGSLLEERTLNIFHVTVINPDGREFSQRLAPREYYQIVAASSFKQRARMAVLYYHAERAHHAVVGTANKNEHDLGFFVKHGDGGVDVQPIAHLFKTEVYRLADHLQLPAQIVRRLPTTDTYSAEGTQEEFFFRVPFDILDPAWAGYEAGVQHEQIAASLGLTTEQVDRIIVDVVRKHRTTEYQRTEPVTFRRDSLGASSAFPSPEDTHG